MRDSYSDYWPDTSDGAKITLHDLGFRGQRGRVYRGVIQDEHRRRTFCLKWCPGADPAALKATCTRTKWWRECHPELTASAVNILHVWPDEQVILLDWRPGYPLGWRLRRHLPFRQEEVVSEQPVDRDASAKRSSRRTLRRLDADRLGTHLGDWLRRFAAGHVNYGPEVDPLLGLCAGRRSDGRLIVDARRLLEQRIERGEQAARTLRDAGISSAACWDDHLDIDAIAGSFGRAEAGGFIHGDFKPDNILVHGGGWSVIDWWTTPRVSWPLTDVATFAGNLWFYGHRQSAERLWQAFSSAYYTDGCDERTSQAIDLVSTIMRLTVIAEKIQRPVIGKRLARRWCKHLVRRPSPPKYHLGNFSAGSQRKLAQKVES